MGLWRHRRDLSPKTKIHLRGKDAPCPLVHKGCGGSSSPSTKRKTPREQHVLETGKVVITSIDTADDRENPPRVEMQRPHVATWAAGCLSVQPAQAVPLPALPPTALPMVPTNGVSSHRSPPCWAIPGRGDGWNQMNRSGPKARPKPTQGNPTWH